MVLSRIRGAFSVFDERGWREVLVKVDQSIGVRYFDFSPLKTHELGLNPERSNAYRGSATDVCHILKCMEIAPGSSIIDIGAGKGRAMIAMAAFPFKTIAGVEISADLTEIARKNLSRAFLRNRTEMTASCASVFDDYDRFSHFYFYNPFPSEVLRDVMTHIRSSLRNKPRESWLIYNAASSDEVEETICTAGVFERHLDYQPDGRKLIVVYRSKPID